MLILFCYLNHHEVYINMILCSVDGCLRSADPFLACIDPIKDSNYIRKDELPVVNGFLQIQDLSQSYT